MINNDEYRPFHEPWHAQIFALTIHLNEQGHFEWKDWSQAFSEALSLESSNGAIVKDEDYYLVWLKTFEEFLAQMASLSLTRSPVILTTGAQRFSARRMVNLLS